MDNKFKDFLEAFEKMHVEAAKLREYGYVFSFDNTVITHDSIAEEREELVKKMNEVSKRAFR